MKKFFSRFSTTGPTSPSKLASDAAFDRSEKHDLALSTGQSQSPSSPATTRSTGRTKALVAKFEGSVTSQPRPPHPPINLFAAPQLAIPIPSVVSPTFEAQHRPSPFDESAAANVFGSVPKRMPGSSLPAESPDPHPVAQWACDEARASSPHDYQREQRQASSSSQATSSIAQTSKSVAFAPSPQKQRSKSPAPISLSQRAHIAPPLSRANSSDNALIGGSNTSSSSNFARPTAASQARSRTWTRSVASDASHHVASFGSQTMRDKNGPTYMRSSRLSQASSARSIAQRSCSHSSTRDNQDIGPLAAASASSALGGNTSNGPLPIARRASLDAARNRTASPNQTNDYASPTGPLSFPTRASISMRKSYSGSNCDRPMSRTNSLDAASPVATNGHVGFPPSSGSAMRPFGFPTWSDMTNQELVRNLGPRERTRQEVLWEIVASEERYVTELEKAKNLYINPLINPEHFDPESVLPPISTSPALASIDNAAEAEATAKSLPLLISNGSVDLPIAARFMSSVSTGKTSGASIDPAMRTTQAQQDAQPRAGIRSPYAVGLGRTSSSDIAVARSGLEPNRTQVAYGLGLGLGTTATRDRSTPAYMNISTSSKNKFQVSQSHKLRGRQGKANSDAEQLRLTVPLPPSLREVLVAMSDGLVEAHGFLSDALKIRYEEQWPLVRSLADVFVKYSQIFEHYARYVCHLQRAMEELEEAALMERAFRGKRLKKERLSNTVGLGRTVAALEACAAQQGYAGLSIFVSMPFQRLLKYPLLFQNLLFHTDPSTHEFESTVGMVVEVERLVRSIEDEKVNAEDRDKTRDAFARIDGITDRQVLRPRSDRILIEEKALYDEQARRTLSESAPNDGRGDVYASDSEGGESGAESAGHRSGRWSNSTQSRLRLALKNKRSYRRLSDFLSSEDAGSGSSKAPGMGSKRDLWLVRFSDVEIKCQRIGVTALPMVSTAALRNTDDATALQQDDKIDFSARSKGSRDRLKALRNTTLRAKTRNLYKFICVVGWRNAPRRRIDGAKEGQLDGLPTSHEVDEEDEEGGDDDDDASVSSAGDSSASNSSSSGNSDGVGGQAASEKYIRSTKLSFTYWGDRIEPARAIGGVQAAGDKPAASAQAETAQRASHSNASASADSTQRSSVSATNGTRATRQARWSTTNSAESSAGGVRSGGRVGGIAGRLSEPLAATSMSTAPESMQTAVAQMHAKQRNEKFGGRMRKSIANGDVAATMVRDNVESGGSHTSVSLAGNGSTRRGSASAM